jgi:LPS sulfotransferase NodH
VADDAFDACGDRRRGAGRAGVRRSLLLCSSPRSGSSLLADALLRTNRVGWPTEYFDPTTAFPTCYARWGATSMRSYVAALHRHRTTGDGLLSAKVHWFQLQWLCRELAPSLAVGPGRFAAERAVLAHVFPACRYVRVTRRDRDRQAVSWAMADQLNRWRADDPRSTRTSADFVYDFATVDGFRRRLDEHEAQWDQLLGALGVDVLAVVYEDLVASYPETVAAVAAYADVDLAPVEVPPARPPPPGRRPLRRGPHPLPPRSRGPRGSQGPLVRPAPPVDRRAPFGGRPVEQS